MKDLVENSQEIDCSVILDSEISKYTQPDKIGEHSVIDKAIGNIDTDLGSISVALVATEVLVDVGSLRKNIDDTSVGDKSSVMLDDTPVVPCRIRKPAAICESPYVSKFDSGCSNVQGLPTKCIDKGNSIKHIFSIKHPFTISITESFLDIKLSSFNKFVEKSLRLISNPSSKMEIPFSSIVCSLFVIMLVLLLPNISVAEPRSQTVKITCRTQLELNTMTFVPNFVGVMETISQQMRTRGYGVAVIGPEDRHICGNRTTKSTLFPQTTRRIVQQALANAPSNNGSAHAQVLVPSSSKDTTYVLANCYKTLSANSCTACLQNSSASMLGCLPLSESRALYIGCFMRYSDTNFLNALLTSVGSSSRGKVVVIVIVVSSVIVLRVGDFIGISVWKNKQIQKKRKGENSAEKLVEILHDISLNFNYSILDKATRSFDEANKLGFDISKLFVAS
ncbi:putative lipase-like [Capsicum annuum]|nr:putative lipase-like [Capsicum annuum]KAF3671164.1 putative lipase-like [Capsicum annuum]